MRRDLVLRAVRSRRRAGNSVVSARIGFRSLWLSSRDVELQPSVEGFSSLLWLAAAARGQTLRASYPVDRTWRENLLQMLPLWEQWWNYTPRIAEFSGLRDSSGQTRRDRRTGLFFTLGVDSFFTLLRCRPRPDSLVFVHGFDIPLGDTVRAEAFDRTFKSVAGELGLDTVVVRTNLRSHRAVRRVHWDQMHGAALAIIGHVLGAEFERLLISSSVPLYDTGGWGSHRQIDPLWSSSGVQFMHVGGEYSRRQKVQAIAAEPLVQRHLRVCWENRRPTGNCSECDKCVSTMAMLEPTGWLPAFETFDTAAPLADRIDRVPTSDYCESYQELLTQPIDKRQRAAIERLLQRSGAEAYPASQVA